MKLSIKVLFLAVALVFSANLQAGKFTTVSKSSVDFSLKNAGFTVNGNFSDVKAKVTFDESNLSGSSIYGIVKASSVSTGNSLRDRHLRNKSDFFNVAKYPSITMKSVSIKKISSGKYTVTWDLKMKGVSKRIKTTVYSQKTSSGLKLTSNFSINRNTWGLGGSSITMGDMVTMKLATYVK